MLIPASTRLRGVNIAPHPDDFAGDSVWAKVWENWRWDDWLKPMIDDAVTVGANVVRMFGNTHVVTSGRITQQQYLDRWTQLLNYTQSVNIRIFPTGGDLSHWGNATTWSAAETIYTALGQLLHGYNHVVGVDITNEAQVQRRGSGSTLYNQPESWFDTIKHLGEIMRSASGKPITHSRSDAGANGSIRTDMISDFLDLHVYYGPSATQFDYLYTRSWAAGKQVIIGEFGMSADKPSADRTAYYNTIRDVVLHDSRCVGALAWAMYDMGTGENQFGLYDTNRQPRTDITLPFSNFPVTR